jgi:hypothetical protein
MIRLYKKYAVEDISLIVTFYIKRFITFNAVLKLLEKK